MKILVLDGPNINMLGIREPGVYGKDTYQDLLDLIDKTALDLRVDLGYYQSNHEGDLVDKIQEAYGKYDGILINPAAYTHTSLAIADALKAVGLPVVEVHITDTSKREDFRKFSYVEGLAIKTIKGRGIAGYKEGLVYLNEYLKNKA